MRFTDVPGVDAVAARAARGNHEVELEDADCPAALRAVAGPYLQITINADQYSMPFEAACQISLRFMQLQDPVLFATLLRRVFNTNPLTRSWQLIAAGLGWPTAPVGSLLTVSLRKLLQMIDRVVMNMPDMDKAQLQIVAGDMMDRLAPAPGAAVLNQPPYNTRGAWLTFLSYKDLVEPTGGSLASFVDMVQSMPNFMSDVAYSDGASATRAAYTAIAAAVRLYAGNVEGAALAEEFGVALANARPPPELRQSTPHAGGHIARLVRMLSWAMQSGAPKAEVEAQLLRRDLPECFELMGPLFSLIKGGSAMDSEQVILEFATEAELSDRDQLSLSLGRRASRALKDDSTMLEVPDVARLDPTDRLDKVVQSRANRDLARSVAPALGGAVVVGGGGGGGGGVGREGGC